MFPGVSRRQLQQGGRKRCDASDFHQWTLPAHRHCGSLCRRRSRRHTLRTWGRTVDGSFAPSRGPPTPAQLQSNEWRRGSCTVLYRLRLNDCAGATGQLCATPFNCPFVQRWTGLKCCVNFKFMLLYWAVCGIKLPQL